MDQQIGTVLPFPTFPRLSFHRHGAASLPQPNKAKFTGPISGQMWQRVCREMADSIYPDSFDYTVFDKLARRFETNPPRGGFIFKSFFQMLENVDCENCFHRWTIDTYGRGCLHNCAYCYSKSYLSVRRYWNEPMPFPLDIVELRKMFYTVFETDRHFKWRSVMEKRVPLRIGCMSDGFMALDKQFKVTLELLKILKFYKYPYTVVTRSDLVADDEYLAEMDPKLGAIHMSLISCNEKLTRIIEPGAPSPMRRLSAIEKLTKAGFWTVVRINPLFPIYPDGYYSDPNYKKDSAKSFDCFSWDMVDQIAAHGTKSLVAGIVRLYPPNVRFMNKALNADIRDFFPQNTKLERNSIHFSQAETDYYYNRISEQCAQRGIRFSTCYIGNDPTGEAFHRYQGLWANKSDCCDVIGNCSGMKASTADFPVVRKPTCQKACSKRKRRCGGEVEVKNIQQSDCDLPAGSGVYDGINVQFPISNLIMRGEKTVETRTYAIPKGYVGKRMILIETPGRSGKFKARMIGFVTFGDSFEYPTEDAFYADSKRHCVTPESEWRWQAGVRKFGWPVLHVELWDSPVPLKKRSGIKFSKGIEI